MANIKKDFSDKEIKCKKCFALVGWQRLNAQCLVIGSLCFFNFARFACLRCETINGWQSVNLLPDENESLDRRFPDRLEDVPAPTKELVRRLGVKDAARSDNDKCRTKVLVGF